MNVKTVLTALAAALYSASSAHAAIMQSEEVHKLEALKVTAEQIKQYN